MTRPFPSRQNIASGPYNGRGRRAGCRLASPTPVHNLEGAMSPILTYLILLAVNSSPPKQADPGLTASPTTSPTTLPTPATVPASPSPAGQWSGRLAQARAAAAVWAGRAREWV